MGCESMWSGQKPRCKISNLPCSAESAGVNVGVGAVLRVLPMSMYLVRFRRPNRHFLQPQASEKLPPDRKPESQMRFDSASVVLAVSDEKDGDEEFIINAAADTLRAAYPDIPLVVAWE